MFKENSSVCSTCGADLFSFGLTTNALAQDIDESMEAQADQIRVRHSRLQSSQLIASQELKRNLARQQLEHNAEILVRRSHLLLLD